MQNQPKPSLPMPSKRTSVMARSPDRVRRESGEFEWIFAFFDMACFEIANGVVSASSSDDESVGDNSTPERDRMRAISHTPSQSDTSSTGSSRDNPSQHRQNQRQQMR